MEMLPLVRILLTTFLSCLLRRPRRYYLASMNGSLHPSEDFLFHLTFQFCLQGPHRPAYPPYKLMFGGKEPSFNM